MSKIACAVVLALLPAASTHADQLGNTDLPTAFLLRNKLGSTNNSGHTLNGVVMSFPSVALGGTSIPVRNLVDAISGSVPNVGALCALASATATPMPATMLVTCGFTDAGVATVTATPLGGLALGAQSFTANVFWNW